MKQLFWKEWHESRAIVAFSTILFAVTFILACCYARSNAGASFIPITSVLQTLLGLFWVIPAALASASMASAEVGNGTLQFLSSIPISRNKIWWSKVLTGLFVLALSIACSLAAFIILYLLARHIHVIKPSLLSLWSSNEYVMAIGTSADPNSGREYGLNAAAIGIVAAIPVFAVGSVATVLTKRAINALLLLPILAAAIAFILYCICAAIGYYVVDLPAMPPLIALATLLCLYYSNRVFVKCETLQTTRRFTLLLDLRIVDVLAVIAALVISILWLKS